MAYRPIHERIEWLCGLGLGVRYSQIPYLQSFPFLILLSS